MLSCMLFQLAVREESTSMKILLIFLFLDMLLNLFTPHGWLFLFLDLRLITLYSLSL